MRLSFALLIALVPSTAFAQTKEIQDQINQKLAAAKWILARENPGGGFALTAAADAGPGLRPTNGAIRALKYLGAEVPNKDKHAAFVMKCYDPAAGTFAEPDTKPDVGSTAIGILTATELGIPHEKYAKAMDYLKVNAKTFEDVRIGAAAVEAWGVKECPFKLDEWFAIATKQGDMPGSPPKEGGARDAGSLAAMYLRVGRELPPSTAKTVIVGGQRDDGGWGKAGEKASDVESTYRVMRALYLLKEKPKDGAKLRAFLAKHRNADGGSGTTPGGPSNMSGTYYAAIITKWLDELEKK